MFYAKSPDMISTKPLVGGFAISDAQYAQALSVLTDPDDERIITFTNGAFALERKYYAKSPDILSPKPVEGGHEITEEQHLDALSALANPDDHRIITFTNGAFALERKFFARAPNAVSTMPLENGVEITEAQFNAAVAVLTNSEDKRIIVFTDGVFSLEYPPGYEPEPEPEPEPLTQADYAAAIQLMIDETARSRKYSDGASLASYVASTVPAWAAEAQVFVSWRDAVWIYAYGEFAKVQAGQRAQPTIIEIISELPMISWPAA